VDYERGEFEEGSMSINRSFMVVRIDGLNDKDGGGEWLGEIESYLLHFLRPLVDRVDYSSASCCKYC
jgi:hypothetical protein